MQQPAVMHEQRFISLNSITLLVLFICGSPNALVSRPTADWTALNGQSMSVNKYFT